MEQRNDYVRMTPVETVEMTTLLYEICNKLMEVLDIIDRRAEEYSRRNNRNRNNNNRQNRTPRNNRRR